MPRGPEWPARRSPRAAPLSAALPAVNLDGRRVLGSNPIQPGGRASTRGSAHPHPVSDAPGGQAGQSAAIEPFALLTGYNGIGRPFRHELLPSAAHSDLEAVAAAFPGVTEAYAVQAGREVRVIVDAAAVSDAEAPALARAIAKAVEQGLSYPGEIRVTVLRETQVVDWAR